MEVINCIINFSQEAIQYLENLLAFFWSKNFFLPLLGAGFAFYLNKQDRKKEENKTNIAAGNLALSILFLQLDTLARYKRDAITPHISDIKEEDGKLLQLLILQPNLEFELNNLNFDIKSLQFLLKEDKTIIVELLHQQINYYQHTIRLINARSKHILDKTQDKIDNFLKSSPHSGISLDELKGCLSKPEYEHLKYYTINMISYLEKTLSNTIKNQLEKVLFKIYGKDKFITFALDNSYLT